MDMQTMPVRQSAQCLPESDMESIYKPRNINAIQEYCQCRVCRHSVKTPLSLSRSLTHTLKQ